jgi:transposase
MGHALLDGAVFLFIAKSRTRAKALYFDGTGVCLFAKRLEVGRFAAPWLLKRDTPIVLTVSELALFFEGSEVVFRQKLSPSPYVFKPVEPRARLIQVSA